MNRKKYLIIIALVIFVFLAVFTFANPLNKDEDVNDKEVSEEKEDKTDKEKEEEKEEEGQVVVPVSPNYNNHGVDINKKPQVVVDNSYEDALKAVEKSETTFNSKDYDEAFKLVELVKDETKKVELDERLSEVKEIIELTDFVDSLVKDVKQASSKIDMDNIRKNIKESKMEERLSKISNELIKKLLIEKLETIADKIEDDKNPEINIEDGAMLTIETKITVTDDSEVTIILNNEEIENNTVVGDGEYVLTATDASFNTVTITFTVEVIENKVGTSLTINNETTEYSTLTEALEVLNREDAQTATLTIYGEQEINVIRGFGIGGANTKSVNFVGGNSKAKITNVGNGHTNISATNPDAVISYEGLIIADTTRYTESKNAPYTDWEFSYSDYSGNFNFTNCTFERSPLFDSNGENQTTINITNCTFKQYDDEAKDLRYSVWVYSGANVTIKDCTFEGARGIKVHKNYEKVSLAGKIVIDNNTFNSLSKKPGIAVGTITNLATTIEITNNTFIGNVPGDQGLYTYESDTVGPTVYENNTLNGEPHTIDNSVFNKWLNKQVQIIASIDATTEKYATLGEALTAINTQNAENAKVTVYGNHELKPEALTLGGTNLKTLTFEKGNDTSKITIVGNGTTKTRTGNEDAVVTFNGVSIDDTSVPYTDHWNFYYTEFEGNFTFNNVKFYHQPLTEEGNFNFINCIFENGDSSRYAIWLYGGNVNITGCNFTGTRGLKLHSNYGTGESYWGQLGKVVIDGNTFNALTEKPGVVVGHVNSLDPTGATIIEITNNTFINTTKPGDQGNYVYESDTVGPNVWSNNTLNGSLYTLDTTIFDAWLNSKVQVNVSIDATTEKYATLGEALTAINTQNAENAKVTVYGNHELKPEALTLGGTNLKTLTFEKGNDTSKITIVGNGTTKTRTGNEDAVVTFNGVSIDDTSVPYTDHWNFYYTEFEGNFTFNNVKFYHQPLTEEGNFNFINCIFENGDSSRYAIWLYGGNVNITGCNFTGTRGLKLHSNYGTGESYWGQLGKVVIDGNTFNALTEKPGVVVGHVNSLDPTGATTIEITNNTFINTTKPGDQGNYVYESDTVGPNVWSNNTLNDALYTLDTSVYN